MKAMRTYRDDWVVKHWSGTTRPGVFMDESAAIASMYLTEKKLRQIYVPMRDGGTPLTKEQVQAAMVSATVK